MQDFHCYMYDTKVKAPDYNFMKLFTNSDILYGSQRYILAWPGSYFS